MKKSECSQTTCCQIGDKWYLYSSEDKCNQDQQAFYNTPNNTNTTTTGTNYPPCTVYYAYSNKYETYTIYTPEECKKRQNYFAQPINFPSVAPLSSILPANNTVTVQQCKDNVLEDYQDEKTNCYNIARAYGLANSSWVDECIQTATDNYEYAIRLCE